MDQKIVDFVERAIDGLVDAWLVKWSRVQRGLCPAQFVYDAPDGQDPPRRALWCTRRLGHFGFHKSMQPRPLQPKKALVIVRWRS